MDKNTGNIITETLTNFVDNKNTLSKIVDTITGYLDIKEPDNCPVCLTEIEDKGFVSFNCGHLIHFDCYMTYLITNSGYGNRKKCMMCRSEIIPLNCRETMDKLRLMIVRDDYQRQADNRLRQRNQETAERYRQARIRREQRIQTEIQDSESDSDDGIDLSRTQPINNGGGRYLTSHLTELPTLIHDIQNHNTEAENLDIRRQFRTIGGRWVPRRGSCGYIILQRLYYYRQFDGQHGQFIPIDILIRDLSMGIQTIRSNVRRLISQGYADDETERGIITGLRWLG